MSDCKKTESNAEADAPKQGKAAQKQTKGKKAAKKTPKTPRGPSTGDKVIEAMKRPEGATVEELLELSKTTDRPGGWQPHTLRGFVSGMVRKKMGLNVEVKREGGVTTYRLTDSPSER